MDMVPTPLVSQCRVCGGKPLLGLAKTVQFQVSGCGGEASAGFSEHCSVSGLG